MPTELVQVSPGNGLIGVTEYVTGSAAAFEARSMASAVERRQQQATLA